MMPGLLDVEDKELEEKLLYAGRDVEFSQELQTKTILATGALGAGLAIAKSSHAGGLAWLEKGWPLFFGVAGAGSVAALLILQSPEPKPTAASLSRTSSLPVVEESSPSKPQTPVHVESLPVESESGVEILSPVPTKKETQRPRSPSSPKRGSLGAELRLLSQASDALKKGSPRLALMTIAEYRRNFPHPQLSLEAEALSIQALAQSGQNAAARSRAENFARRHPKSPLLGRVKRHLK